MSLYTMRVSIRATHDWPRPSDGGMPDWPAICRPSSLPSCTVGLLNRRVERGSGLWPGQGGCQPAFLTSRPPPHPPPPASHPPPSSRPPIPTPGPCRCSAAGSAPGGTCSSERPGGVSASDAGRAAPQLATASHSCGRPARRCATCGGGGLGSRALLWQQRLRRLLPSLSALCSAVRCLPVCQQQSPPRTAFPPAPPTRCPAAECSWKPEAPLEEEKAQDTTPIPKARRELRAFRRLAQ